MSSYKLLFSNLPTSLLGRLILSTLSSTLPIFICAKISPSQLSGLPFFCLLLERCQQDSQPDPYKVVHLGPAGPFTPWGKDAPLLESGLLGPVTLRTTRIIRSNGQ